MNELDVYKQDDGDRPVERSPRGRYIRFDIRLGSGAYKTVYKAYDTDQGIDVAWNAIDIGVLPSSEKARIIQEVQLLQKLEHKNIINFYGSWFSKEKNQVVFITEIMTSGNLKSYIKRVQFVKWKIIKRWCLQILEGLHYLHSQQPPVIHRDLKCDNIFINGNTGDLRIGDLGLSTQLAVHKRSAQSVLGTPEFMAPELYDESYDEKVDIYSFGMCVLEMVTKEVPYSECINPAQIYRKVTAGVRPRGLQRIESQGARDFIELCLSRGNGELDVSAEYLLDHPFLKPSDDDNEMVRVRSDDELERDPVPTIPNAMNAKSFADQITLESASKGKDETMVSDRRKNNMSLSLEPEELATGSGANLRTGSSGASRHENLAEEKSAGKLHMLMPIKNAHEFGNRVNSVLPPLAPAANTAVEPAGGEPLSDNKKSSDEDNHVTKFLSTMPGSESKIRNDRIAIMGGRNQRIEIDEGQIYSEDEEEVRQKVASDDVRDEDVSHMTQENAPQVNTPNLTISTGPDLKSDRSRATDNARTTRPASAQRNRGKRYEIKATRDPDNEHSILLNLRIAIDGKSKEIKFPFNLYTESPHEVACELAVDVGILEPDLEAIADSISFLVTEGKINDLPDIDHDIWDEAPEPYSFSTKPLPHVSKMSFGTHPAHASHHFDPLPSRERSSTYSSSVDTGGSHTPLVQRPDQSPKSNSSNGSSQSYDSGVTTRHDPSNEIGLKVPVGSPTRQAKLLHASSENALKRQEMLPDLRDRGISTGSAADVAYMRAVRQFEDRVNYVRSSTLEEAIRNEEEKHQRELDRIRKKMQQFNEKTARATQARQERMKSVSDPNEMENEVGGRHSPPHRDDNHTRTTSRSPGVTNYFRADDTNEFSTNTPSIYEHRE